MAKAKNGQGREIHFNNKKEVVKWADLTGMAEEGHLAADLTGIEILAQGKCIRRFALIVSRIAKFHLSQRKESRYIARNAIQNIGNSNNYPDL